jgi:hypothetical protein
MALDVSMAGNMAALFQMLPLIFSVMQLVVYAVAVLFFGSIAIRGWRGYLSRPKRLLMRLALGLICVVTGTGIAPLLAIDNVIFKMLQFETLLGMVVASIVMLVSLRLMTLNVPYSLVLKRKIKSLMEKLEKREDKNAEMPKDMLRSPATIAGIVIFAAFIVLSLLSFRGFPDMQHSIYSAMGLSDADIAMINDAVQQYQNSPFSKLSASCQSAIMEMQGKDELSRNPPLYENDALKAKIESGSGQAVSEMHRLDSNGLTLIKSVGAEGKQCFATTTDFCICA